MSMRYASLLEEALEAWDDCRAGVIEEVQSVPPSEFGWRPAPGSRSVAELVRHIVESSLMWVGELTRADGDFRRQGFAEFVQEYAAHVGTAATRAELLDLLRDGHADGDRLLRAAGELHMLQFIHRFDGQPGTRLAWLHHGVAHEMYHRGQLALYVRLTGRMPALTRRIG